MLCSARNKPPSKTTPLCPAGHLPLKGEIDMLSAHHSLWRAVMAFTRPVALIWAGRRSIRSPPSRGRCPAGQRGVRRTHFGNR